MHNAKYAGSLLNTHFKDMHKMFGQQDLVMRWLWYTPLARDWNKTSTSLEELYYPYVTFFREWYRNGLQYTTETPYPASLDQFTDYISQLPSCFIMKQNLVRIANATVCNLALVKWKADTELWHSLMIVDHAVTTSQVLLPNISSQEIDGVSSG